MGAALKMPDWPRRMKADLAAAYLGISTSKFLDGVRTRRYPAGRPDGRNLLWDRKVLDLFVDVDSGLGDPAKLGDSTEWEV